MAVNKVVTSGDLATYPFAQVGDIVIVTGTSANHADGKVIFNLTTASSTFAGARTGSTIWIDGNVGTFYYFRLTNGEAVEWKISTPDNYVHVRPFPGTQVKMTKNPSTNSGFLMIIFDIKYMVLDGENDAYPGLRDGWPNSPFLSGNFGFHLSGEQYPIGGHMLNTNPFAEDGGFHIIRGVEASQGFAGFRYSGAKFASGSSNVIASYKVERCYIHDAGDGEGLYIGATHSGPMYLIKDFTVVDTVISRRACELIQAQLLVNPTTDAKVTNCVLVNADMDWLSAFQPGQDTGIQWSLEEGNNKIENCIIDSTASVALNHFGGGNVINKTPAPAVVKNCLFARGRGIFSYAHNLTSYGVWRIIKDCYLKDFDNSYYANEINDLLDYYVSTNNGTDRYTWMNIVHDGAKTQFFQSKHATYEIINISDSGVALPDVQYKNSGYHESTNNWVNWKETYANYHDNPITNRPVTYQAGWIVCNIEQGVEYKFYKVMSTHTVATGSTLNPRQDYVANGPVRYMPITWDANGVRSDQPSWVSGTTQSIYPPDDFRLVSNNHWNKMGMGLLSNEPNTDHTLYQWYRADDNVGTNKIAIPGAVTLKYIVQECDQSKYLALGIKARDAVGNYDIDYRLSNWVLVA